MTERSHAALALHESGIHGVRRVRTWRKLRSVFLLGLLALLTGGVIAAWRNHAEAQSITLNTAKNALRYATLVHAEPASGNVSLNLPATLLGQTETPISARTSGYLLRWTHDIGSRVRKGELLAEISSPEIQQQLVQASAARQQAVSALSLAKLSLDRWQGLLEQRAVSQQEFDERRAAHDQAIANLEAAEANQARLKELMAFTRVLAPFSGVITKRNVNLGDLIEGSSARPLFILTQADALRTYIYVPQAYAKGIHVGQSMKFTQAESPSQVFTARVVRTAQAIDPASRSLQVELAIENADAQLLPGSYVQVALPIANGKGLVIPVNTLLLRGEGPRVAVVNEQGIVKLQPVTLGKDYGAKIEVLAGVSLADNLVLNPNDGLADGDKLVISDKKAK
jgi:RND family efflux transporter MFP subunit